MPFEMDAWGIDLVVSASQKAFMASPGIALAALGPAREGAEASASLPRVYWTSRRLAWAERARRHGLRP